MIDLQAYEFEDLSARQKELVLSLKKMGEGNVAPKPTRGEPRKIYNALEAEGMDWEEACQLARIVPYGDRNTKDGLVRVYQAIDEYEKEWEAKKQARLEECQGCVWSSVIAKDGIYCPWAGGCYKRGPNVARDYGTLGATL